MPHARAGGLTTGKALQKADVIRADEFWRRTIRDGTHLVFQGCDRFKIASGGRYTLIRRVAWALECGAVPAKSVITTICGMDNCVEVDHLQLHENAGDAAKSWSVGRETATRFTPREVTEIRQRYLDGEWRILKVDYEGRGYEALQNVVKNRTYRDPAYDPPHYGRGDYGHQSKLTAAEVSTARRAVRDGASIYSQAMEYGTSYSTMYQAIRGETWAEAPEPPVTGSAAPR